MSIESQLAEEIRSLEQELSNGLITLKEFNERLHELEEQAYGADICPECGAER